MLSERLQMRNTRTGDSQSAVTSLRWSLTPQTIGLDANDESTSAHLPYKFSFGLGQHVVGVYSSCDAADEVILTSSLPAVTENRPQHRDGHLSVLKTGALF